MLNEYLIGQTKKIGVDFEDFQRLLQRMLDYGVICRDESQTEMEFYDLYLRCKGLVDEFLMIMDIRIDHQPHFQFLRLFPPGAHVPGLEDVDAPFSGFRARLSQAEVAFVLVLRHQYEQLLHEGNIDDLGCAPISIESLNIAMKSLLNRSMPIGVTERRAILIKMRQLRLIKWQPVTNGEDGDDTWLKIRPMITSMVTQQVLQSLQPSADQNSVSENALKAVEHS